MSYSFVRYSGQIEFADPNIPDFPLPRNTLITRASVERLAQNVRAEKQAQADKKTAARDRKQRAAGRVAAFAGASETIRRVEQILFSNSLNLRLVNHAHLRFIERRVWVRLGFALAAVESKSAGLRSLGITALSEALWELQEQNFQTPEHETDLPEDIRDLTVAVHDAIKVLAPLVDHLR